jgi:guanine deaminase
MIKKTTIAIAMKKAIKQAHKTMNQNIGGPFGAAIIDKDGRLIAVSSNTVLQSHDPTAHAEMNAIRIAGEKKKTHDLTGCTLITTAFPCPMCLGAIVWANIKQVTYGCTSQDAEAIGFRDDFIYQLINNGFQNKNVITLAEKHRKECLTLFEEYKLKAKTIY